MEIVQVANAAKEILNVGIVVEVIVLVVRYSSGDFPCRPVGWLNPFRRLHVPARVSRRALPWGSSCSAWRLG